MQKQFSTGKNTASNATDLKVYNGIIVTKTAWDQPINRYVDHWNTIEDLAVIQDSYDHPILQTCKKYTLEKMSYSKKWCC